MKKSLNVRTVKKAEMEWVNKCYNEVEFVHYNFDKEIIVVAELEGHRWVLGGW